MRAALGSLGPDARWDRACWHNEVMSNSRRSGRASAEDPHFWHESYPDEVRKPPGWADAAEAQRCVLFCADEQDCLSEMLAMFVEADVDAGTMVEVGLLEENGAIEARYVLHPATEVRPSPVAGSAEGAIRKLTPVVRDLVTKGVVEIREFRSGDSYFDDALPLPEDRIDRILADPRSWFRQDESGRDVRIALANRSRKRAISGESID
jgi:hypothetical protein